MSDVMLFGVLRMPEEMAMANELSRHQFYQRAQEAADRLEVTDRRNLELAARIETLMNLNEKLAQALARHTDPKPDWKPGNLLTMAQDAATYPGMGNWFGQIWEGDILIARVFGNDADEVRERMSRVLGA